MKKILSIFKFIIAVSLVAVPFFASAQALQFSTDLKVGSSGADVTNLQTYLIQNGYHIPSLESGGLAKGYFGSQTKSAVIKYQVASGLPATGFVGPLTRKSLNTSTGTTSSTATPSSVLATAQSTPATSGSSAPSTASAAQGGLAAILSTITTPGASGIMSVTQGPLSSAVLNVGAQMVPIMAVRVQAQYSDIAVPIFALDLGTDTSIYNKIFKNIYITDGKNVLYSTPLNSSTVVQVQGQYILGAAGFNFLVPKGHYKDLIVKADLYPSIDSKYINASPWYISVDPSAVAGYDGAATPLYGPSSGSIIQALTINKSLVDNAQANLSVDGTSPVTNAFPVTDTTNGNYLGLPVMVFDVYAQNDTVHLHNVQVNFTTSLSGNTTGAITAAYLYQGSTQVQSASVSAGVATFSNITDGTAGASVPVGTTLPYTIKVDVTGVTAGSMNVTASMTTTGQTIYNSIDGNVTVSGSASGNTLTVNGSGASFNLASAPTIMTSGTNNSGSTLSTSTIVASFPINISSVGLDSYFGTVGSSTPAFYFTVTNGSGAVVYTGYGTSTDANSSAKLQSTQTILPVLPTQVTNGVTQLNSFKVANQNTVSLGTVQFQFAGKDTTGTVLNAGPYKVNLSAIRYVTTSGYATSSFMNGLQAWTTPGQNP